MRAGKLTAQQNGREIRLKCFHHPDRVVAPKDACPHSVTPQNLLLTFGRRDIASAIKVLDFKTEIILDYPDGANSHEPLKIKT